MKMIPTIDCQSLAFSARLSQSRMSQAMQLFGASVLQRVLSYSLYVLGVNRNAISQAMGIPSETAKSILKTINRDGLSAFEDRRRKGSSFLPQALPEPQPITIREEQDQLWVDFGISGRVLKLNREDPLQVKTILLTMVNSGLLTKRQAAEVLKLTPSYTASLARRLDEQGACALVDRRQGQKKDFRVPREVKAELVQQFAVDVITSGRTSGSAISAELKERCSITIPSRTVRHHLARMGLRKIKGSLPQLVSAIKKTP